MQLVNFHYFYNFSKTLQELNKIQSDTTILDNFAAIFFAESSLRELLANDILPPQTCQEKCRALADLLAGFLDAATTQDAPPRTNPLSPYEVSAIQSALRDFEGVLESEYRIKPVFAPSKKGLYSLEQLVFRGHEMVPESVHELMPNMKDDLRDAGRCIAFEVPTAGAFHLFRAAEAGVEAYILAVRGSAVTEKEKKFGLGGYANILRGHGVDDRVLAALEQLTKLHRNPTIHPTVRVGTEEVLGTLGMVDSLIRIIGIDLQRRATTPDKSLDEFLPMLGMPQGAPSQNSSSPVVTATDTTSSQSVRRRPGQRILKKQPQNTV